MNKEEAIKYLEKGKDNLPLSFHYDLDFKSKIVGGNKKKVLTSIKYHDSSFSIITFYKPISRLK